MKEKVESFLKEKFPHFLDSQEEVVSNVPVFFSQGGRDCSGNLSAQKRSNTSL